MRFRKFLTIVVTLVLVITMCPASVFSVSASALTGSVSLGSPVRLVSPTGDGAFMPAMTFTPGTDTCFTMVFDIQGASAADPYEIGGVTGSLNGGINPNNSANMPVGWTMSYTGNGYKYLSVGLYFWQWLDPSTFQINSLSLSDPSGTRSGATDVSANPDATFELIDIVSGGAVYDITFKSEDGTVTYDQVAGTVSNPNQWGATGGDFPTLASIYSTVPVKQGQDGVEYEFAGWVDETGAPVTYAAGTQTVYASFCVASALTLNTTTAVTPSLASPDQTVSVSVSPSLTNKAIKDGTITLTYNPEVVAFVSGQTGSEFSALSASFTDDKNGAVTFTYTGQSDITGTTGPLFTADFKVRGLAGNREQAAFAASAQPGALSDSNAVYNLADDHSSGLLTVSSSAAYSVYEQGVDQTPVAFTDQCISLIGENGLYSGTYTTHDASTRAIGFLYDVSGITSDVTVGDVYSTFYKSTSDGLQNTNSSSANIMNTSSFTNKQLITQDGRYLVWFGNAFLTYATDSYLSSFTQFNMSDSAQATKFVDTINTNTGASFRLVGIVEAHTDTLPGAVVTFKAEDGTVLQTYTADYSGGTHYWFNANQRVSTLSSVFTGTIPDKTEQGILYRMAGWQTADGERVEYADRTMTVYPYYEEVPAIDLTLTAADGARSGEIITSVGFAGNRFTASTIVFDLTYDSDVYTYKGVTTPIAGAVVSAAAGQAGTLTVTVSSTAGIDAESGILANIAFDIAADADYGSYTFSAAGNQTLSVTEEGKAYLIDGASAVGSVSAGGLLTYYDYEQNQPAGKLIGVVLAPAEKWQSNPNKDVNLAIDGDFDTVWKCSGQNYYTAKLQYYGFDFGGSALLSSFTFKVGGYTAEYGGIRLEVSNDNTLWTTIWSDTSATASGTVVTVDETNWDTSVMNGSNLWRYARIAYGNEETYAGWNMLSVYEFQVSGQVAIPERENANGYTNPNPAAQTLPAGTISGGVKLIGAGSLYESAAGSSAYTIGTDNSVGFTVVLRFEGVQQPITLSNWNGKWRNYQATNAGNGVSKYSTIIDQDGTYMFFFPVNTITWTGSLAPLSAGETIESLMFMDSGNTNVSTASANPNENATVALLGIYDGFIPDLGVRYEVNDGDWTGRYYAFASTGITGEDGTSDTKIKCVKMATATELFSSAMPVRSAPEKADQGTNAYVYSGWKNGAGQQVDAIFKDEVVYVSFEAVCNHNAPHTTVTTEPTCTDEGRIDTICSHCQQVIETQVLPAAGHSYVQTVLQPATYLNPGIMQYVCSVDGYSYTEAIPVLTVDETSPILAVGSQTAYAEGNFVLPVTLTNNPGVSSIRFVVSVNSTQLTLSAVSLGGVFDTMTQSPLADGSVQITLINSTPGEVSADGTLVNLAFSVSENAAAGDVYTVSLSAGTDYNDELAKDADGQTVALAAAAGSVTIGSHVHQPVTTGAQAPSYWHEYYTGDTVCPICGKVFTAGQTLPALTLTETSPYIHVELAGSGTTYTATLSLVNNPGLIGLEFDLVYDEAAFDVSAVSLGSLFDYQGSSFTDHAQGPIRFVFDSALALSNVEADGVLAVVTFTVDPAYTSGVKAFDIALSPQTHEMGYDINLNQVSIGALGDTVTLS